MGKRTLTQNATGMETRAKSINLNRFDGHAVLETLLAMGYSKRWFYRNTFSSVN